MDGALATIGKLPGVRGGFDGRKKHRGGPSTCCAQGRNPKVLVNSRCLLVKLKTRTGEAIVKGEGTGGEATPRDCGKKNLVPEQA